MTHRTRPVALLALLPALLALLVGCSPDAPGVDGPPADGPSADLPADLPADDPPAPGTDRPLEGELIVFAAASLTEAFEALATAFEAEHRGIEVVINIGGSQALVAQLREGAVADVFASADAVAMDDLSQEGLVTTSVPLVRNRLEIAVEPGNPAGVTGLADLARDDLVLVMAAETVPAGRYSAEALAGAGVEVEPDSLELDVRAVVSKVALGEADVGLVYRSDVVAAAGRIDGVPVPPVDNVEATYPIAVLDDAPNPAAAEAFVAFARSDAGRAILLDAGFEVPS